LKLQTKSLEKQKSDGSYSGLLSSTTNGHHSADCSPAAFHRPGFIQTNNNLDTGCWSLDTGC